MYHCEGYILNWLITLLCTPCAGDGMPVADFCDDPMTPFNGTVSFLPGEDVTITCSVPVVALTWTSPQFSDGPVTLVNNVITSATRLNGSIVFNLTNVMVGPPQCTTSTATITNIQESMQGLSLTCTGGSDVTVVIIDIIGELHVYVTP